MAEITARVVATDLFVLKFTFQTPPSNFGNNCRLSM